MTQEQRAIVDWLTRYGPESTQCVLHSARLAAALRPIRVRGWRAWTLVVSACLHAAFKAGHLLREGSGESGDPFIWSAAGCERPVDGVSTESAASPPPVDEKRSEWFSALAAAKLDSRGRSSRTLMCGVQPTTDWLHSAVLEGLATVRYRGGQAWLYPPSSDLGARLQSLVQVHGGLDLDAAVEALGSTSLAVALAAAKLVDRGAIKRVDDWLSPG